MKIRIAQQADLVQIVEIYNQAVALKSATADLDPLKPDDRVQWLEEHVPEKYPVYVAEVGDETVGWCSLSPYRRGRMALRYTAEISYYIHEDYRRKGIGSALVKHAIAQCEKLGIKTLFALLLDVNVASVKLLEKFGFAKWGHMPNVADFDGQECGHLIYGLRAR
jgi:L-amino acid N-acyltransferase YncA